jgi:hypothetical protein
MAQARASNWFSLIAHFQSEAFQFRNGLMRIRGIVRRHSRRFQNEWPDWEFSAVNDESPLRQRTIPTERFLPAEDIRFGKGFYFFTRH